MAKPDRKKSENGILPRWLGILLLLLFLSGCQPPVSEYLPRNPTETAILSLLVTFQKARNHRDIHGYLSLLHPHGQFTYACGVMVSKAALAEKLPEFWKNIDHKKLGTVPLAHECLNGDYYTSGVFKNPEITVTGNRARVKVMFTRRWWSSLHFFLELTREKDRWQIIRTWWGPS